MSFGIGIWERRLRPQRRNHERNPIRVLPMRLELKLSEVLFREWGCRGGGGGRFTFEVGVP
jgi:hypothetical protein